MSKELDFKIDGFDKMYEIVRKIFKSNLLAIFVHGSIFDGTFDKFSDFDIVIITKKLPKNVLKRDLYAQKLKRKLIQIWTDNPFSFDFITRKDLLESADNGHPFIRSVLKKGSPVFDPHSLFSLSKYRLKDKPSAMMKGQMYTNLLSLSKCHYMNAQKLATDHELVNLSLAEATRALNMLVRAKMIKKNKNIYKGELYQFFIREYSDNFDPESLELIWKYGFHANQIVFRMQEPHVDMPIQNSAANNFNISKLNYTQKLIRLYDLILRL